MEAGKVKNTMFFYTDRKTLKLDKKDSRRYCIAGLIDVAKERIFLHKSRCSKQDCFKKSVAREIALGRAKKDPILIAPFKIEKGCSQVFVTLAVKCLEIAYYDDELRRKIPKTTLATSISKTPDFGC